MMIEKGRYVVAALKTDKGRGTPFLLKVDSVDKSIVQGTLERNSHISQLKKTVEVLVKDVVADLGTSPHYGKAYGCDTSNIYAGRKSHDDFGSLHFFYKPEKEKAKQLTDAFTKVSKSLVHAGLDFLIDPSTCIWEILPYHGEKYAGMYIRSKNVDKTPHRFQIRPEMMPYGEFPYVIYHELGHHLHLEFATGKKLQAEWVRLYNTSIKVTPIKKEKSQELLDALLAGEDRPSDFKTNLSEEDTLVYKWIIRVIGQQHSLSIKELDLLFEAQYFEDIRGIWPVRGVPMKDLAPIVTEYATKNFKELIAESFAFRMVGKKLPKSVDALLDKTLSYAKANHDKS